jgi:hypothetical protein
MNDTTSRRSETWMPGWVLAVLSVLFLINLAPSPYYIGNQNLYLLSGLAKGGYGELARDPLISATLPFPAFDAIVEWTQLAVGDYAFHVFVGVYLLLAAAYLCAVYIILCGVAPGYLKPPFGLYILAAWILLHASYLRAFLPEADRLRRVFTNGFAAQQMLGGYLQPSDFAVLLFFSLAIFLIGRYRISYAVAALSGILYPPVLVHAGILIAACTAYRLYAREPLRPILVDCMIALALALPIVIHTYLQFLPETAANQATATGFLVNERFPHHARIETWFGTSDILRLLLLGAGILASRFLDRRLYLVMLWVTAAVLVFSAVAVISGRESLMLLFPWRTSVLLIPLSTLCLLITGAKAIERSRMAPALRGRNARLACLCLLLAGVPAAAAGEWAIYYRQQPSFFEYSDPDFRQMAETVKSERGRNAFFLFAPDNFESFRLATGMPAYVDKKSHPFQSEEVLAWIEKFRLARRLFSGTSETCPEADFRNVIAAGVNRVIIDTLRDPPGAPLRACLSKGKPDWKVYFKNRRFTIYEHHFS